MSTNKFSLIRTADDGTGKIHLEELKLAACNVVYKYNVLVEIHYVLDAEPQPEQERDEQKE